MYYTIYEALCGCRRPEGIAIEGIGKTPMTYGLLKNQVEKIVHDLHRLGFSRGDRIAVMLPNGPELAVTIMSVAAGFTCAPLNPMYTENELDFYLSDMRADAIVLPEDAGHAAVSVARSLGIPLLNIFPDDDVAGVFNIDGEGGKHGPFTSFAGPEDIAMVLHTSGTTSRPKLVPILHSSMAASAWHIKEPLGLTEKDKSINVMPLFHVHGLIGSVLASLVSGGSVVCAPGFQPDRFMGWLKEYRPTWYTAVPAIHQLVLKQAASCPEEARASGLRLIRSTSAALPLIVMERLESMFGVPVIEGYGMTEAPHQISINPMPPRVRKSGSVGIGIGIDIAVIDDMWKILPPGTVGEIALKGSRIISGYENNPEANAKSFKDGWFRTGDTGYLDDDGYLFIDGRIKEIINKGGEKISPKEVEEALLSHPAVSEAAVFMVPDPSLGENVGAVVVLNGRENASIDDLKRYLSGQLTYYKVPVMIRILDDIPKGSTGKIQRVGMYDRLMADASSQNAVSRSEPPATPTEIILAGIWADVLHVERIGRNDSFFEIGGDSLRATMVVSRITQAFNVKLNIAVIMDHDTVSGLGAFIDGRLRP